MKPTPWTGVALENLTVASYSQELGFGAYLDLHESCSYLHAIYV
jgi:hypothetical protein